ncbi:Copper homeostasis protein CutC [Leucobacter aridicollis]|uniref:copper homeostasis protein CutC n=1 Tax=Leucobacter aridicollis TaxID=283878 RepID=UPI000EB4F060|nr:copper homeostasis protein CutC [Leucobacter aridicollis]MCS3429087.1 copper homeostasis protein [Leucobacter aridicollis]RKQ85688.1 copper homeostasis protein CutC [Mycolicibacterium mucogenicum 261Sha1.1M5]
MTLLEIAVQDVAGARTAIGAGADRLELCQALGVGGLTPSIGTIEQVADAVGGERIAVLVRPRPGGFVYDADEVELVSRDIAAAAARGAGGMVVGALTETGLVDTEALRRWREAAGDADLVFHRAIDTLEQPETVLESLVEAGVTRILTSGGAVRSLDGAETLARLVEAAEGRLDIMAGGGVTVEAIPTLVAAGVAAIHLSAKRPSTSTAPSGPGGGAPEYDVTDAGIVAAAAAALAEAAR